LIQDYHLFLLARGRRPITVAKVIADLRAFAHLLGKDFDNAGRPELIKACAEVCARYASHEPMKASLKAFYRWLKGDPDGPPPPETAWLKITKNTNITVRETDLLKDVDVVRLLEHCWHPRDIAVIMLLWHSGIRAGELLRMRIKDVAWEEHDGRLFATVSVTGKTGQRDVFVEPTCAEPLKAWLELHPGRGDTDALVWVSKFHGTRPIGYSGLRWFLKRLMKRAGLDKPSNPHLFRHTAASRDAEQLREPEMCRKFGWTLGSHMPRTYVHLNNNRLKEQIVGRWRQGAM
jgi:integrase